MLGNKTILRPFFFVLSVSLSIWPAFAQRSPDWLTKNDRGNRYEGSYTRKVSNLSIDLLSLTGYFESYEFGKDQTLQIKFYSPEDASFRLKAEELVVTQYYWMQAKENEANAGWNQFGDWPVDYYLKRLSVSHRNLGVLIQYNPDSEIRHFLPAFISHSKGFQEIARYVLQFRLGRAIVDGQYKVFRGKTRAANHLLTSGKISSKSGGTSFPLVIPVEKFKTFQGWISVEVNCRERGTLDPFSYSLLFYHTPD